jgi:SpoVK/Ycf46/Vps4 family AAA+-type ATPase
MESLVQRLVHLVVWFVLSAVISYALGALGPGGELGGGQHEAQIRASLVDPREIDVTLADVGGLEAAKQEIYYSLLLPLKNPHIFFRPKGPFASSKGVLLTGPPGCGKTMLMRAVAKECGCAFLSPQLSTLQSKYYGETQKILKAMFDVARANAPCILFIDEIDSAFRSRSSEDAGCEYALKSEFLLLMDGLRTRADDAVVVVGATNHPDALDDALRRRLPVVIEVAPPAPAERRRIAALLCADEPRASLANFDALDAKATDGFSGSDLAELYRSASRARLRRTLQGGDRLPKTLPALNTSDWRDAARRIAAVKPRPNRPTGVVERQLRRMLKPSM